jgi:hypothetical protein
LKIEFAFIRARPSFAPNFEGERRGFCAWFGRVEMLAIREKKIPWSHILML